MIAALTGQGALWLTLASLLASLALGVGGLVKHRPGWLRTARTLVVAAFGLATIASAALLFLLVTDDFSVAYVAERSARAMPLVYKIGAWWGGQEGSLLFWLWLLLVYASLLATARPDRDAPRLWPVATAVLAGVGAFFAWLVAALESPFRLLATPPADGVGLNPLLQSPSMLAHPAALYLGYVGLAVPFAMAVAGLIVEPRSDGWVRVARRWAMVPWFFLGLGIVLGGEWAYKELGWGGYWGWDPVENASLVPWLLLTGFVHSAQAQERRGTLRRWNAVLILLSWLSVLLGTFVTRSGVLASVHAFAESPTGPYFMGFIGVVAAVGVWGLMSRWDALGDARPVASALSREGAFIAGNLVLVSLAFAVAFGTAVPIVSRLFGPGITVQAPYFERVSAPLFTLMLVLMGVGLSLPWNPQPKDSQDGRGRRRLVRLPSWVRRLLPAIGGSLVFGGLLWAGGVRRPLLILGLMAAFLAGGMALAQLVRELSMQWRRRNAGGWGSLSRLGAAVAHAGVAVLAVGVVASTAFQAELSRSLQVGQSASVAGYTFRFEGMSMRRVPGATEVYASLSLYRGDRSLGRLEPAKRLYDGRMAEFGATSEVALLRQVESDVYVALAGWDDGGRVAAFEFYVNPMVNWIWLGSLLMLAGTGLAAWALSMARQAAERKAAACLALSSKGAFTGQAGVPVARVPQQAAPPPTC
ncbi:cytochrome c-type biogenesis CcmF C-terminal domain-containing protein [Carboxydochorda subterranea]|uniref:Cytochrome c-type biogenesis CcmF C-terminal domain-containing protein n=1 Tax=Carboxydichorda subterranea TaxID=3109565 RepID=A0ABZ1BZ70_9FIRM|nr:cytochrome c-type biogenesis CcmF C-terminal domain-containing protein [Limnochorda sp. L945t]WRP17825.1 cytochrome c-type biogenesis CcmF C-terminal domain-containing protein [Limnochorda sp. L945t]